MRTLLLLSLLLIPSRVMSAQGPRVGESLRAASEPIRSAQRNNAGKGLLIGAAVGAGAGGALGAWIAHGICDKADCSDAWLSGLGYGLVAGAVVGGAVGAGIGALSSRLAPNRRERKLVVHVLPALVLATRSRRPALGIAVSLRR